MKRIDSSMATMTVLILDAQERAVWMPEEATAKTHADAGEQILSVTHTCLPKKTAGIGKFKKNLHH